MSRRKRHIRATDKWQDGKTKIDMTIDITVDAFELTRDEHDTLIEQATSAVMATIPNLSFIDVPLSKVKVS